MRIFGKQGESGRAARARFCLQNAVQTPLPPKKGEGNRGRNLISPSPVIVLRGLLCCLSPLLLSYLTRLGTVNDGDSDLPINAVDTAGHPAREAQVWPSKANSPSRHLLRTHWARQSPDDGV